MRHNLSSSHGLPLIDSVNDVAKLVLLHELDRLSTLLLGADAITFADDLLAGALNSKCTCETLVEFDVGLDLALLHCVDVVGTLLVDNDAALGELVLANRRQRALCEFGQCVEMLCCAELFSLLHAVLEDDLFPSGGIVLCSLIEHLKRGLESLNLLELLLSHMFKIFQIVSGLLVHLIDGSLAFACVHGVSTLGLSVSHASMELIRVLERGKAFESLPRLLIFVCSIGALLIVLVLFQEAQLLALCGLCALLISACFDIVLKCPCGGHCLGGVVVLTR